MLLSQIHDSTITDHQIHDSTMVEASANARSCCLMIGEEFLVNCLDTGWEECLEMSLDQACQGGRCSLGIGSSQPNGNCQSHCK